MDKNARMRMPGFYAEASLYEARERYQMTWDLAPLTGRGIGPKSSSVMLAVMYPFKRITCVCDDQGCCCAPIGRPCTWHPF